MAFLACVTPSHRANASPPVSGFWYAIGHSPTAAEINSQGPRYKVVVLNAWDADKMRLLRSVNPGVVVLVYKDLSSTRSYPGAVDDGKDAKFVPSGVGYVEAQNTNQEWFAHNTHGSRIEWNQAYPGHWQMAVWDHGYQDAWVENVVAEVVDQGWDGVLADNDIAHLGFYTNDVIAGTSSSEQSDQRIRDGLDALITAAGWRLNRLGKLLIPNISEARLFPGRWTEHSRFGGGMEEYFPVQGSSGEIVTVESAQWEEMLEQSKQGSGWLLLITHGKDDAEIRTGFALAALLGSDQTAWMAAAPGHYEIPAQSAWPNLQLGGPTAAAVRESNGAWHRQFASGWVAVNPTESTVRLPSAHGELEIPPGQSVVVLSPDLSRAEGVGVAVGR